MKGKVLQYESDIVSNVNVFLASQNNGYTPQLRIYDEVVQVARKLGYGEPFDLEQKAINALLCKSGADDQLCLTVWAYYHDMKINHA